MDGDERFCFVFLPNTKRSIMKTAHQYDFRIATIHTLRINVKSLSAESRFIRKEERRCGSLYRENLYLHRTRKLREESRYTQLALAFVRGRKYQQVESNALMPVNSIQLANKLKRHVGERTEFSRESIEKWLTGVEQ